MKWLPQCFFSAALAYGLAVVVPAPAAPARDGDANADLLRDVLVRPGYELQLVHRVDPKAEGSWVSLTAVGDGRLVASAQFGRLFVITPGDGPDDTVVKRLPVDLGMAQGLCVVQGDLYVMVNAQGPRPAGLYRCRDTDGDQLWDQVELLRELGSSGEHGPHAVVPSPSGESLYVACGNVTKPTEFAWSRVPTAWGDDSILPRIDDPLRSFSNLREPGGWIAEVSLDGKDWRLHAAGFRNQYDIAFNRWGDLFTFDSDNEYDIDAPWYRPTRVCHVASGGEFGWRHGTGKWPPYYEDSVGPLLEIGPGSPTGVEFGYATDFPAADQRALFVGDWSHGRVFMVDLDLEGGGYRASVKPFLSASPLPVTDLAANFQDGALYLTTGGRRVGSALWRVVYVGFENPADEPAPIPPAPLPEEDLNKLRREIEYYHTEAGAADPVALDNVWPYLGHDDRHVRYAARVAVELQPADRWLQRAYAEADPRARPYALLAATRHQSQDPPHDLYEAFRDTDFAGLTAEGKLAYLRAVGVSHLRYESPELPTRRAIVAKFAEALPSGETIFDRELAAFLLAVGYPDATATAVRLMEDAPLASERLYYALALCETRQGWTPELRRTYYQMLGQILAGSRDRSMQAYAERIAARADEQLTDEERTTAADLIAQRDEQRASPAGATPPRPLVREWNIDQVVDAANQQGGDPTRGRRLFAEAQCFTCHRFRGEGGAVGPDLTAVGRRFAVRDIATALVDPNATISDQYRQTVFEIDGRTIVGRVVNLNKQEISIATDFTDPKHYQTFDADDIEDQFPSNASPMPAGLLNVLDEDELLDLMAYLLSTE
ncbi:Cytochrome c [Posidoniimonas polymericola]|uniref:Cytochrome c n=1 Tax=Posidoniimonas polymericola TaxID=2528002 RepID=A0A5C5YU57_9BACT|nr:c-type cytochrome [Posidoniimonas polymericola]TWT78549.1 Cytochrome c [Posidoniimonas polymericola]